MNTQNPTAAINSLPPTQALSPRSLSPRSRRSGAAAVRRGFTLLEMVLVAVLIAALATVVVVNVAGKSDRARERLTITRLAQIKNELLQYNTDYGTFPPSLVELTQGARPYLDKIPTDDFKRPFVYQYPGTSGDPRRPYDLFSFGKDGVQGTPDDIDVWTMSEN